MSTSKPTTWFVAAVLLAGCGEDDAIESLSIAGTAQTTAELSTLAALVEFASEDGDLVDLLADPGTLTAFAPTNAAFDALAVELGAATATDLLIEQNRPLLREVLAYHVLPRELGARMIPLGSPLEAIGGGVFKVDSGAPPVITDGRNRTSNITAADIDASNGVVHVIDRVLLPADKDLVETAAALPGFSRLLEAVQAAGLASTLTAPGPLTVFAPTDDAFAALLAEQGWTEQQLLADTALLTAVLRYHVVPGRVFMADAPIGSPLASAQPGGSFTIDGTYKITDARGRKARLTRLDVLAENGVIHVIDNVLLPPP